MTRRKTVHRSAPRVAAACSSRRLLDRSAPSTVMMRKGMATKASAMTTAAVVNGIWTPNTSYRTCPTSPRRPNASRRATPPTTGGRTSGRVTRARTHAPPKARLRHISQASGIPSTREIAVAASEVTSESRRATSAASDVSRVAKSPHGACASRAIDRQGEEGEGDRAGHDEVPGGTLRARSLASWREEAEVRERWSARSSPLTRATNSSASPGSGRVGDHGHQVVGGHVRAARDGDGR